MKSILTACITTIVCLLGFSQIVGAQELPKTIEFNVTGLLLSPKTLTNIIVSPNVEIRTGKSRGKLGLGLSLNYSRNIQEKRQDISFGPRINYHLSTNNKVDFYVGGGVHYGTRKYDRNLNIATGKPDEFKVSIKYQMGGKCYIGKHFGAVFELSNYNFSTGFSIVPTIGINVNF